MVQRGTSARLAALTIAVAFGIAAATLPRATAATPSSPLPFSMPPKAKLHASPHKVFAHYFTPYPVSIDNLPAASDYYTKAYLNPDGENGKFAANGGLLRDRPLPQNPGTGDWELANFEKEITQASNAGLDGFTVDVLATSSYNWDRVKKLFAAAEQTDPNFKLVLMPDATSVSGDAATLANTLLPLAKSPAAYRLADGRVVVSPFYADGENVQYWKTFINTMAANGVKVAFVPTFLDFRSNANAFAPISYGFSNWGSRSVAANSAQNMASDAALAHSLGKIWMQPVSTQDERPNQSTYDEADNTSNLRATWQGAVASADWVQMTTWNDYSEGTQFAPSVRNNSVYLDLSSFYLTRFKIGKYPVINKDVVYITHRIQRASATPKYPETKLMQLRDGSSAPRDDIEVLAMLTSPAKIIVSIGGQAATYSAPAGGSAALFPLKNGIHSAKVVRNGTTTAAVSTKYATVDHPDVQDLQYYAVSSAR